MPSATWGTVERPILETIDKLTTPTGGPGWEEVVVATGLSRAEVQIALRRLFTNGWVDGFDVTTMGGTGFEILNLSLTERALNEIGVWPTEPYEELVSELRERIDAESDAPTKSRLERLLGSIVEVGESVTSSVLADVIKRTAGL